MSGPTSVFTHMSCWHTEGNHTFTLWIYLLGNVTKQEESIHHHCPPRPKMNEETLSLTNSCKDKSLLLGIIEGM